MSVKSLQIYDYHCQQKSPCVHNGKIEKLDGSYYEGPICSGIANAILSTISLDSVQVLPDRSKFGVNPGTDYNRKFKFYTHVYNYQQFIDKPLSVALASLPFQQPKDKVVSAIQLPILQKAIDKAKSCNECLTFDESAFSNAPAVYFKLKAIKDYISKRDEKSQISEDEIRAVVPYLAQANELCHTLGNNYKHHAYKRHAELLKRQYEEISKALESKPSPESVKELSKVWGHFHHNIRKREVDLISPLPGTVAPQIVEEIHALELRSYSLCLKLKNYLREAKKPTTQQKPAEQSQDKKVNAPAVPLDYICPLSQDIMVDPVITPNGTSYERPEIEKWLSESPTCPFSRDPLKKEQLVPNRALKNVIDQWKQQSAFQTSIQIGPTSPQSANQALGDDEKLRLALNEFKKVFEPTKTRIMRILERIDDPFTEHEASQFIAAYKKLENSIEGAYSDEVWQEVVDYLKRSSKLLEHSYIWFNI